MWKQYFLSPVCAKCGSFLCDDSLFCETCFENEILARTKKQNISHIENHFYLLDWPKNESAAISEMVYRMKSDYSSPAWNFYVEIFMKKFDLANYDAIIPIPGSKPSSVHAQIFARALAIKLNLPVLDILQKDSFQEQKTLTAKERKSSFRLSLKQPLPEDFTHILLVDDILTTGQSYLQAQKALGPLESSFILTLFYRPHSG